MTSELASLGVRRIINAAGPLTRLGGGALAPHVVAAMTEAASTALKISELQAAAGRLIAEATGAETGYVTSGAAAGLTLAAAACLAGADPARMDALPDASGMPNEIVIQKPHAVSYNHALRASGARLIEAGYMGYPGTGATYAWQVDAAIGLRTAALAFQLVDAPNTVALDEMVRIAHAHDLPLIVDAAAALPPVGNLRSFIDAGADLVAFSGGKAIGGPQASGILCGRADLIRSVALQHQDYDVLLDTWELRASEAFIPHHGIGRSMKVGKEEILGLTAALRAYMRRDHAADAARWTAQLRTIVDALGRLDNVSAEIVARERRVPLARIQVGSRARAVEAILKLESGDPRVAVSQYEVDQGCLVVNPLVLLAGDEDTVVRCLVRVLG